MHIRYTLLISLGLAALGLTACVLAASPAAAKGQPHENSNILWQFVHGSCAPAARENKYPPRPCAEVSAPPGQFERGYVVFKDRRGRSQYLVLPLARITGIGSPSVRQADAPNYFADAWTARLYVDAALHKIMPRDALILAVNSKYARSQNQLHVHVDCIRADVKSALRKALAGMTGQWKPLPTPLRGHAYMARWVGGASLAVNPFRSLASSLPAGDDMDEYGLAVGGAWSPGGKPGFILLATRGDIRKGNYGNAEELQDHACALANGS